jgi:NADH-quinone oxidoreductase subunit N
VTVDINFYYLLPEMILGFFGFLVLLVGLKTGREGERHDPWGVFDPEVLAFMGLFLALIPCIRYLRTTPHDLPTWMALGAYVVDKPAIFFKLIAISTTILVVFLASTHFKNRPVSRAEVYSLLIFAALACCLVASSNELIMLYLSLEFLSLASYVMVGYFRRDPKSGEAALKYLLFGAGASAVGLFGMSLLYGLTGTTDLTLIAHAIRFSGDANQAPLTLSLVLMAAGFGFKISMVPFHFWAPDAYEGAPGPVAAFLSVASKSAGFIAFIRVFSWGVPAGTIDWVPFVSLLAMLSMTVGNVVAVWQKDMRRLLAYSGIAHCGYILIGVIAMAVPQTRDWLWGGISPMASIVIYIAAYAIMNIGVFAFAVAVRNQLGSYRIEDYKGLASKNLPLAVAMAILLLSLAGIPPTVGFLGKFFILMVAVERSMWVLAFFLIGNTVVSLYYYYNIVRLMFLVSAEDERPVAGRWDWVQVVVYLTTTATLLFCVWPGRFLDFLRGLSSRFPLF